MVQVTATKPSISAVLSKMFSVVIVLVALSGSLIGGAMGAPVQQQRNNFLQVINKTISDEIKNATSDARFINLQRYLGVNSSVSLNFSSAFSARSNLTMRNGMENICKWNTTSVSLDDKLPKVKIVQCLSETARGQDGKTVKCKPIYFTLKINEVVHDHHGKPVMVRSDWREIPVACVPESMIETGSSKETGNQPQSTTSEPITCPTVKTEVECRAGGCDWNGGQCYRRGNY